MHYYYKRENAILRTNKPLKGASLEGWLEITEEEYSSIKKEINKVEKQGESENA